MTTEEALKRIQTDPDFIYIKRFDYSIKKLLERYPDGDVPYRLIAQGLMITEEDAIALHDQIVEKLRQSLVDPEL